MSCLSRLLGLICAIVPGLFFLGFSVLFFQRWPQLGLVIGPLYSLASLVTGAVCLYLGANILFERDKTEEIAVPISSHSQTSPLVVAQPQLEAKPLQAAPLPVSAATPPEPVEADEPAPAPSIFISKEPTPAPLDSPEARIRQLAQTRPNWQVTAPQLAHLTNLNMAVADATARAMAQNGQAQMQVGPNGETIYIFDLANTAS